MRTPVEAGSTVLQGVDRESRRDRVSVVFIMRHYYEIRLRCIQKWTEKLSRFVLREWVSLSVNNTVQVHLETVKEQNFVYVQ